MIHVCTFAQLFGKSNREKQHWGRGMTASLFTKLNTFVVRKYFSDIGQKF